MSTHPGDDADRTQTGHGSSSPNQPDEAQLAEMSRDELVRLGSALDDVEIQTYRERWPVPDTRAERRAQRKTAGWFGLAALAGLAFLGVFIFWPSDYVAPGTDGYQVYALYTPLVGITLGLSILGLGMGVIDYSKRFLPEEVSVQQRHDGPSEDVDRQTTTAILADAGSRSGITRRSLIKRSAGAGAGAMGLALVALPLGGLIKDPWAKGADAPLWVTPWHSEDGERVYLRRETGIPGDISLVRPEELAAGGFETVFPFKESQRGNEEELSHALRASDAPVMLLRLRPEEEVIERKGQTDFNYGQYYAYSKICTHMGCPTSLYEQQTGRMLCPCHQSQFDINQYAKPIFGPATRALPQLPIDVDEDGYFYARHGFIEPVGPAFWERRTT